MGKNGFKPNTHTNKINTNQNHILPLCNFCILVTVMLLGHLAVPLTLLSILNSHMTIAILKEFYEYSFWSKEWLGSPSAGG